MDVKDPLEITILKATIRSLESEVANLAMFNGRLLQDLDRYRNEAERLQNLWYKALAQQIFPPVQVQTIKMNVGDNK